MARRKCRDMSRRALYMLFETGRGNATVVRRYWVISDGDGVGGKGGAAAIGIKALCK